MEPKAVIKYRKLSELITRDGVLVTVLSPTKERVHHRKEAEQEVS